MWILYYKVLIAYKMVVKWTQRTQKNTQKAQSSQGTAFHREQARARCPSQDARTIGRSLSSPTGDCRRRVTRERNCLRDVCVR